MKCQSEHCVTRATTSRLVEKCVAICDNMIGRDEELGHDKKHVIIMNMTGHICVHLEWFNLVL